MRQILRFLTDLVYPQRCSVCGEFVSWDEFICESCRKSLEAADDVCKRCGKGNCICQKGIFYDACIVPFYYIGAAKDGIYSLKDGQPGFGQYLGQLLGEAVKSNPEMLCADFITAVPMTRKKRKLRGFNQAEIIAKELSGVTKIKTDFGVLHKNDSAQQHTLSSRQRAENVSAFSVGEQDLTGMKIILCDDVITTGSTVDKCAKLLKEKGALAVYAALGTTTKLKKDE